MRNRTFRDPPVITINPQPLLRILGIAGIVLVLLLLIGSSLFVVQPGYRGVEVRLGKVNETFKDEGLGFKIPFITVVQPMSVRQQTRMIQTECYDLDLQPVAIRVNVLFRIPEQSVVTIFRDYRGEAFDMLVAPRVQEALKEVTANRGAEMIVQQRRDLKVRALQAAQRKIGTNLLEIVDLVLFDIRLPAAIEDAIENKMVQEQAAEKARFTQQKMQIQADTEVIRARGLSEAIGIRGEALRESTDFIKLRVVEKWDGRSPLVVGGGATELLLNTPELQQRVARPASPTSRGSPTARETPRRP